MPPGAAPEQKAHHVRYPEKICDVKVQEVAAAKRAIAFEEMRRDAESRVSTRDFVSAIRAKIAQGQAGVIAEVKKPAPARA